MKKAFLLILVGLLSLVGHAQDTYIQYESNPVFPGGQDSLMLFIKANLKYPKECVRDTIEGRVLVSFIVCKDGLIRDVKVLKSVNPLLDAEACRVVGLMPKWKPGFMKGEPVNVKYTLPITFKLTNIGSSNSVVAHLINVQKPNENQTLDPKGLYRLTMFSYEGDKAPEIPNYEQYKYMGNKSLANINVISSDDNQLIAQIRTDGFYPLRYTGNTPQGNDGKGVRITNSGLTGFLFTWYSRKQSNQVLFPDNSFVTEWYNNKEGVSDKMKQLVSLCEMKLEPVKGDNLIGCWHRVGMITKVGGKEFLTQSKEDVYAIYDNDNMLAVNVLDAERVRAVMRLIKINKVKDGFMYNGIHLKIKFDGKDVHTLTYTKNDGTEVTELFTRSGLPAKFQELFGTDSNGGIK